MRNRQDCRASDWQHLELDFFDEGPQDIFFGATSGQFLATFVRIKSRYLWQVVEASAAAFVTTKAGIFKPKPNQSMSMALSQERNWKLNLRNFLSVKS